MNPPLCGGDALGQRLRQARLQQGLSEDALARPEFTGNYIQALEQGRACPSDHALAVLARRLRLPLPDLLLLAAPMPPDPDLAALDEDLAYQLDHTKLMILKRQGEAALELMRRAELAYRPYLRPATRCRFHRLRGTAYLRVSRSTQARFDLVATLALAARLNDVTEIARVQDALGVACFQEGRAAEARDLHLQCLGAIHSGAIRDLPLRLSIYGNLANDYWALNDLPQALGLYQEAWRLLPDSNNPDRAARVYWGLSQVYLTRGDLDRAALYARQAADCYESLQNWSSLGTMYTLLAAIMLQRQDYAAAAHWLEQARRLLEATGRPALLSPVYEHYATLELRRGRADQAAAYAYHSLGLAEAALQLTVGLTPAIPRTYAVYMFTRALRTAALVAEHCGRPQDADEHFREALRLIQQGAHPETAYEILISYAEMLRARGAYAQATAQYQAAFQCRPGAACPTLSVLPYG